VVDKKAVFVNFGASGAVLADAWTRFWIVRRAQVTVKKVVDG
jgi:hypothetical protein